MVINNHVMPKLLVVSMTGQIRYSKAAAIHWSVYYQYNREPFEEYELVLEKLLNSSFVTCR
jgi:hypothetical protein